MARSETTALPRRKKPSSHVDAAAPQSVDTQQLLGLATALAEAPGDLEFENLIERFLKLYRPWILNARGMTRDADAWAERHSILLHLMVGGTTLREAVGLLMRFMGSVWGMETRYELSECDGYAFLVVDEPEQPGPEGVISTLWILSIIRCQLEFLAGHKLEQVSAILRNGQCLPAPVSHLLFGGTVRFSAQDTGLLIGAADLECAVTASVSQIPGFLANLMRATIDSDTRQAIAPHVANLIWRDAARGSPGDTDMPSIARQMGMSPSTLRRQLSRERTSFKDIRGDAFDRLAKSLLHETDLSIERIAERLGYSDAFAFRRAFRRRNGIPPAAFRRQQ